VEHALSAERPERELEEALCDGELRIGSGARLRTEPISVAEIDRDPIRTH
jgi:hypothetical protein